MTRAMEGERSRVPLVIGLALFTLVAGGGGIWLMVGAQQRSLRDALVGTAPLWQHALVGITTGVLIALGAWWIIARPYMAEVRSKYATLIGPLLPSRWAQWFVSICAGAGEELLFRGALQQWLGIPLTALVFVALHGYLDPRDRRISSYGLYLTATMMGLGYMADHMGLMGPIIAHTIIDIVLLRRLALDWKRASSV
ncbi:MAG: CPBP family intramembrane metalloprotease [Flavobacteriales bacterium]|nr:CPBP family intramembrane metalloprotease [Flavobacteriales bacterium]